MKSLFLLLGIIIFVGNTAAGSAVNTDSYLRIELSKDAVQRDETVIILKKQAKPGYDFKEDARYLQGAGQVKLYSYVDQTPLVFNTQPFPETRSVTHLNIFTKADGTFRLKLNQIVNVPKQIDVWLIDDLLKDSIDLRYNSSYAFNISKADTNTFGANRFKIVIVNSHLKASHLLSFAASKNTGKKQVDIRWTTENQDSNTSFIIERSTDNGKTYTMLDSLTGTQQNTYTIKDTLPAIGLNLYRLKQGDFSGKVIYSESVKVFVIDEVLLSTTNLRSLAIYPNPAVNTINVNMGDKISGGNYNIIITNAWGLRVKQASAAGQTWQGEVGDLKPGVYMITITSKTDSKVVGYNKFLKN